MRAVNNFLIDDDRGWLIDFEFAGYRSAFVDIVALYVPGPMWMAVADPAADGTESAYRTVLAEAIPETSDDRRYGEGVAGAALAFSIMRLHRLPLLDRRPPGDNSRLQMIATLDAAAAVATAHGVFPALTGWARRVNDGLRIRWPDADVDLATIAPYLRRH